MTQQISPFISIENELEDLHFLKEHLERTRQLLKESAHDTSQARIKSKLAHQKQEFNSRIKRLEDEHEKAMDEEKKQNLAAMKAAEQEAARNDPKPAVADDIQDDLSSSKKYAEERIKQELGMHHILPTRPEELYKVILIYLAIIKIYAASSQSQQCDQLINGINIEETRKATLLKAKWFLKQETPKTYVAIAESIIEQTCGAGYAADFVKLISRFITYPLADIAYFTGMGKHLPSHDKYPELSM